MFIKGFFFLSWDNSVCRAWVFIGSAGHVFIGLLCQYEGSHKVTIWWWIPTDGVTWHFSNRPSLCLPSGIWCSLELENTPISSQHELGLEPMFSTLTHFTSIRSVLFFPLPPLRKQRQEVLVQCFSSLMWYNNSQGTWGNHKATVATRASELFIDIAVPPFPWFQLPTVSLDTKLLNGKFQE